MELPTPPLLLVTDRRQARIPLIDVVARAGAGGCRWVSVREKDLPANEQIALAQSLKPMARRFSARLTLHGDATLAKAAEVDGVHLSAGSAAAAARALLGPEALVGLSVHSVTDAMAVDMAADYAIAGPVFATASKPGYGPALGPDGLAAIRAVARVPIIAIGGIEPSNAQEIVRGGIAGIAVMGAVMRAEDPRGEIERLLVALAAGRDPPLR